ERRDRELTLDALPGDVSLERAEVGVETLAKLFVDEVISLPRSDGSSRRPGNQLVQCVENILKRVVFLVGCRLEDRIRVRGLQVEVQTAHLRHQGKAVDQNDKTMVGVAEILEALSSVRDRVLDDS